MCKQTGCYIDILKYYSEGEVDSPLFDDFYWSFGNKNSLKIAWDLLLF